MLVIYYRYTIPLLQTSPPLPANLRDQISRPDLGEVFAREGRLLCFPNVLAAPRFALSS